MTKLRILVIYGTRPEAIKLAPVISELKRRERCRLTVCVTAQHRELLDQVHQLFDIEPDVDLDLMRPGQLLNQLASRAFASLDGILADVAPDWVVIQGDTTTAMVGAVAAFHRHVPVAHVEAGLRTGDLTRPFPEEFNRRVADLVTTACFAPTERARASLRREGVDASRIHLTGNTVVDALLEVRRRLGRVTVADEVLVTVHRRESFGEGLRNIFEALKELAEAFPSTRWVFPVHPNPAVREPAGELLGDLANVDLCPPLSYVELVEQLARCRLVLTDSGGIQEEAPTFGKPVLVLRETTERPEGIDAGVARLVGVGRDGIVDAARELLTDGEAYLRMANAVNPYGDGEASARIASFLLEEPWEPFQPRDEIVSAAAVVARSS